MTMGDFLWEFIGDAFAEIFGLGKIGFGVSLMMIALLVMVLAAAVQSYRKNRVCGYLIRFSIPVGAALTITYYVGYLGIGVYKYLTMKI